MAERAPRVDSVLMVDDEDGIRTVLRLTLADKGYEVHQAASGQEALERFHQTPCPIVLTDIKMPGMDGIALLREIKEQAPDTEVVMITGHGDMDLAVKSMQYGAADFITKPVGDDALEVALARAEERIEMRRRIREHTEELERLVAERTEELLDAERMAAVGRTVADLSHTIKNIASGLEGGIYVLGRGIELEERKYLDQGWELVHGNVEKIKNLSLALLNYAKYARVEPAPVDPAEPAREAASLLTARAGQEDVELVLDLPESSDRIDLDHEAMVRLLVNLLDNALDACRESDEKRVELSLALDGDQAVYRVADTGCGLAGEAREKALTGFFSTKGAEGTGVGLMTSRKIAEEHGGTIELADRPGGGTVATVRLPARG